MEAIVLREDQKITVEKGYAILKRYNLLYLAVEVRCGKTIMSMHIAKMMGWRRVCFITKKMAVSSIKSDYLKFGHEFINFTITNYEQTPNLFPEYDGFICDEASVLSAYPKPGVYCKATKKLIDKKPVILMSGSPTAESPSQIFHQLWVSYYSPFSIYKNFFAWAKEYVTITKKYFNGFQFNDYSKGKEDKIKEITSHYTVTLSQEEAGFKSHVDEEILWVDIDPKMYQLMNLLKKQKVYQMKNGNHIVADTPVKMQSLFHQVSSGTVITEEDSRHTLDESKAKFIKQKFAGKKIAIFFKFIEEGNLLRKYFPLNTSVPEIFNERDDVTFICQVVSGRMGVNLSSADALVMYNIDFSATTYFQARARMQSQTRTKASKLYWIFSKNGLEKHVYDAVCRKKNFTNNFFLKVINDRAFVSFTSTTGGQVTIHADTQEKANLKASLFKAMDTNPDAALDAIDKFLSENGG